MEFEIKQKRPKSDAGTTSDSWHKIVRK